MARQNKTLQGIVLISVSVFVLAFADAISKQLSANISIWQIFFIRSLFALPILALVFWFTRTKFKVVHLKWVVLRSILLVLTWIAYYGSFPVLDLTIAAVAIYTFPILVALFSTFLTDEPTTKRQWLGIFMGFIGVVIILKPGSEAFSWFTMLPVLAAGFLALAMILTRVKCQQESPLILSFSQLFGFLVAGAVGIVVLQTVPFSTEIQTLSPFVFVGWHALNASFILQLAFTALLVVGIFSGIARAYQIAPPSIVAVFDYVYLISATIWGVVFFAEKPGAATAFGMAVITLAGILVAMPSRAKK